jgi:hypothetical protein
VANPTEAELITQLQKIVDLLEENRKFGEVNAKNWVDMHDTVVQNLEGDHADQINAGLRALRTNVNNVLVGGRVLMDPHLRDWAKLIDAAGVPVRVDADINTIITALYDYMGPGSPGVLVKSRDFTFGTPSAFSAGKGSIKRLTVDENDYDIENGHPEVKSATCTADSTSGTEIGKEIFKLEGSTRGRDSLESKGSGLVHTNVKVLHPDASLLLNSGFDSLGGTAAVPTSIPDWTSNVTVNDTNYQSLDADDAAVNTYLPKTNDNVKRYSLGFKTSSKITQKLQRRRSVLNPDRPYYLQVAYNAEIGAASGTAKITMGSLVASAVVDNQTGWNVLALAIDKDLWFKNFNEEDLDITAEFVRTAGTLQFDDFIFTPFHPHDGTHYLFLPGRTPFARDDVSSWTDSATESKIQKWFHRLYRRFLPHNATGETMTDP